MPKLSATVPAAEAAVPSLSATVPAAEAAVPSLSVIVPVYKVEGYLPTCIDSILSQTMGDLELILIDDGSPDRCGEICDEYAAEDSRIVVIHQPNRGVSAARNAGLELARGEWIGFVDPDDWIAPNMYLTMLQALQAQQADAAICGIKYYSDAGNYIRTDASGDAVLASAELLQALYGKPSPIGGGCVNKLFRRSSIQQVRFSEHIRIAEDWIFLFRAFQGIAKACHIPEALYHVTERPDSATRGNEADAFWDSMFGGKSSKLLLCLARQHSHELECLAIDKYMDSCIRYSNIIRSYGKAHRTPYRLKVFRMRAQIVKQMPRAIAKGLLSKEKIHGYLYAMIKG